MHLLALVLLVGTAAAQGTAARRVVHVSATGTAEFRTVQQAVNSAGEDGLTILIAPGVYKEKLAVAHANIALVGMGKDPAETVLAWGDSSRTAGGTQKSGTVTVNADGFAAENLTILNTWWTDHPNPDDSSQAVALALSSDRAVVDRVRLISGQDTLLANSRTCRTATPGVACDASREFFNDCYIEGHIDYIFGDAKAVFDRCELHSRQHPSVMITAQSRYFPEENSGYWFLHCMITGTDDGNRIVLGRPWRAYSTVTFLDTDFREEILPEGWWDWDGRLKTATYREYDSHGLGVNGGRRAVVSPTLTQAERDGMTPAGLLAGRDHWDPAGEIAALRLLAR